MPEEPGGSPETGYYVYGVVSAEGALPASLHGIDDVPVELVEHDGIGAATTEIAVDRPPGRRAELMAHTAVVDSLATAGAVLPIAFGSILADRDSVVHDLLAPNHDRFVELLAGLEGRHQFNLRASYVTDQVLTEVVQSHPEIAELRRRTRDLPEGALHPDLVRLGELVSRAMEHTRQEDAQTILDVVRPFALDESARPGGGVEHLLDVAVLVEDDRIPELEEGLETFAEAVHERIRLRLVGPVAPYDFAEAR